MRKNLFVLTALLVGMFTLVGCDKEPSNNGNGGGTTTETTDYLIGDWKMNLDKSYSVITKYDDKQAAKATDAISGATSGGDTGGDSDSRTTYMSSVYTTSAMNFAQNGIATRTYTNQAGTTTNTFAYTRQGNVLDMEGSKVYIAQLTRYGLVLETSRTFLAKGKDVYTESLHLEYYRTAE